MFCEHCHGRVANVHLVRIVNGKKSELHLCNECAKGERFKQTENLLNYSMPSILGKRLFDIFPHFHGNQDYKSFREELRPLFSHNLTKNEPGLKEESIKDEKLAEYEKQLKSAINSEDFEQAAKLRDQIQAYKAQNGI